MSALESLGKVVSTDVLIVGGGIGGLSAAIAAKEASRETDVLIVEKATTGWAGKASKGGGFLSFLTPNHTVDEVLDFHTKHVGAFLEDQELLAEHMGKSVQTIERLSSWGVPLFREEDGSLKWVPRHSPLIPWGSLCLDLDMCVHLRRTALKLGVKTIDKVAMVDLLSDGERIVGAIGFDLISGECIVVEAKATILANGSQDYRVMYMWSPARGDGIAAAYRAGAEMRNVEFANFVNFIYKETYQTCNGVEDWLLDGKGQPISKKYRPHPELDSDVNSAAVVGYYKEMLAGNGPIYADDPFDPEKRPPTMRWDDLKGRRAYGSEFYGRQRKKGRAAMKDPKRPEVFPGFIGEQSPVRVDHDMRTTLTGLWAIGDTSYCGSAMMGAQPSPPGGMRGSGLMFAIFGGTKAGPGAVEDAAGLPSTPKADFGQAKALKEQVFAPLHREPGIPPVDLIHELHEAIVPIRYSGYKSEARMQEALGKVLEVREKLPKLTAKDPHYLSACNEARSMVTSAEMFYRASLMRKETRGWSVREDYPETDNKNWLKWIIVKEQNGEMVLRTEDVPIERYPFKPEMPVQA